MCVGLFAKKNAKLLGRLEYNGRLLGALLMIIKQDSLINKSVLGSVASLNKACSGAVEGRVTEGRTGKGRTCEPGPHYIPISIYCKGRTAH